jgi:hypothetical protein
MTTEHPTITAEPATGSGPSIHVIRARKLLLGGLVGGGVATVGCLIVFGVLNGVPGLLSAALGGGIVLAFYTIGQYVMVRTADAGARTLMIVSMTSYFARFCVIGMFLLLVARKAESWSQVNPTALTASAVAVVIGWLAVEIFVFSRLRIGTYDSEYVAPAVSGEQQ